MHKRRSNRHHGKTIIVPFKRNTNLEKVQLSLGRTQIKHAYNVKYLGGLYLYIKLTPNKHVDWKKNKSYQISNDL